MLLSGWGWQDFSAQTSRGQIFRCQVGGTRFQCTIIAYPLIAVNNERSLKGNLRKIENVITLSLNVDYWTST